MKKIYNEILILFLLLFAIIFIPFTPTGYTTYSGGDYSMISSLSSGGDNLPYGSGSLHTSIFYFIGDIFGGDYSTSAGSVIVAEVEEAPPIPPSTPSPLSSRVFAC